MKNRRLLSPGLFVLGAALCVMVSFAHAAPPHPDLLRTLTPEELAAFPPEPPRQVTSLASGIQGAATQEGRRWTGHPRLLVLLVDFDDHPADRETHDVAYFEQMLFSQGEMEFGSLREYYLETSYEAMDVTGTAYGWFRMPRGKTSYTAGQSGMCSTCYLHNARYLVADAVQAAVDAGVDFAPFDNDGPDGIPDSGDDDGILDGLMVVASGIGAERSGSLDDFRSHYWSLATTTTVGSIKVPDYALIPEEENVGVAVHEYGHVLGGEDLYDLRNWGAGLGYFSVMAYNMWFFNARRPGGPDPYTRALWGFVTPEVLYADEPNWELPLVNHEPAVLRLWTRGEHGREYFLVENRAPVGVDHHIPGEGLLVYHVDETVPRQDNRYHWRVGVVEADGLTSLEGGLPRNMGEAGDCFPGTHDVREVDDDTNPDTRAHDGSATEVALRNIGDPGERMSFSVEVGVFVGDAPHPVLETVSDQGYFEPLTQEGDRTRVRLQVHNRGSRLPPGRLRIFSRDPRVIPDGEFERELGGIGPLTDHRLEDELWVELLPGVFESRRPAFLEGVLETSTETYAMSTPIATEGTVLVRDGFEVDGPLATTVNLNPDSVNPWHRVTARAGEGRWAYGTVAGLESYGPRVDAGLVLGPYEIDGPSMLQFQHYVSTPAYTDYSQEGGFLEASTDGGVTWTQLTPEGGYPTVFDLAEGNPYPGTPAWAGVREVWEEVRVPLANLRGDTYFRFHFVSDYSGSGLIYRGWYVDSVLLRGWDECYTPVFGPPEREGDDLLIGFSVLSILDDGPSRGVRLVREHGREVTEVGRWTVTGRLDEAVRVDEVPAGWTDRFWLEWEDGGERVGPLVVASVEGRGGSLLTAVPAVIRSGSPAAVRFEVPGETATTVLLDLYDIRGALVSRLASGLHHPGSHDLPWPSGSTAGRGLASGVYFLRLVVGDRNETQRVVLVP